MKGSNKVDYVRNDFVISNNGEYVVFIGFDESYSPPIEKLIFTDTIADKNILLSEKQIVAEEIMFDSIKFSNDSKKLFYIEKESVPLINFTNFSQTQTFYLKKSDIERKLYYFNIETNITRELSNPNVSNYVKMYEISPDYIFNI